VGILYATSIFEGDVVFKTAAAIDFNQVVDISGVDAVSMQAIYSDGTPGAHVVTSGARSTGNITVSNFASLIAKKAQVSITVSSNAASALTGARITINGFPLRQGSEWNIGASTLITAQSISAAINGHFGLQSTHTLTANAIIFASASSVGSFFNSYAVTSSTPTALIISAATLTGGQDNAIVQFPSLGVTLTQGTDWTAATSDAQTALNLSTAINANATLSSLVVTTRPAVATIIYSSATFNGLNDYPISVSTPTALTVSGGIGLSGGFAADISSATDRISKTNHFLTTGMAVLFSSGGFNPPGNLANQTTYYVIVVDTNTYKLAASTTLAAAGTAIDISSVPVTFSTYNVMPCTFTLLANNGFQWQASNNGVDFTNLTGVTVNGVSVSSLTYTAAGNSIWDFGRIGYKYLRVVFIAPTRGGIALRIKQYGKKD